MPRYSLDQKKDMARRFLAGETLQQVADSFECSLPTVTAALRLHGVEPRRGPGSKPKGAGRRQPTVLTCTKCQEIKPVEEFYRPGRICKACKIAVSVDRRKALYEVDPEEHRKQKVRLRKDQLRRRYGITMEEAEAIYSSTDECHICGGPPDTKRHYLNIDHCHETGVIRGLLCSPCNRAIGLLQDNPDLLRKAASYLERTPVVAVTAS